MCGCRGYRSAPWWTAKNYLEINTGYIMYSKESHLLCYDDSTSMVLKREGKRRGGRQHKGPLFSGRDKSEVSVWTFNILQGTKRSYSGLVSEFFFFEWRGLEACYVCLWIVACFLVNCYVASRESLPPKPGKSINLRRNTSYARCGTWKKKDLERLACIKDSKGPNSIKPCWNKNIYHKWIKLSKCYLLHFEFLLVILGVFSEAKHVKCVNVLLWNISPLFT